MDKSEGRSLPETPAWAVATVVTILVGVGLFFHCCLKRFGKWLSKTKRKPLLPALEKIKDGLMVFGLLSLLMGHWIIYVTKICVKSSVLSGNFYLCGPEKATKKPSFVNHIVLFKMKNQNTSFLSKLDNNDQKGFCPKGHQSFASHESLEQLHRPLFVLGITHMLYSFYAIALTVVQIYRWRKWENHAKLLALQASHGSESHEASRRMARLSAFVSHHTSHPWSNHRMGSEYKKSIVSENARRSLHGWKRKAINRKEGTSLSRTNTASSTSLDSLGDENKDDNNGLSSYRSHEGFSGSGESPTMQKFQQNEISPCDEEYKYRDDLDYDAHLDNI